MRRLSLLLVVCAAAPAAADKPIVEIDDVEALYDAVNDPAHAIDVGSPSDNRTRFLGSRAAFEAANRGPVAPAGDFFAGE